MLSRPRRDDRSHAATERRVRCRDLRRLPVLHAPRPPRRDRHSTRLASGRASVRSKTPTLAAPIHGKPPEELAGLDRREQRRFRRLRTGAVAALAMLTVTAVVLAVVAFIQNDRAITQRNHAIASRLNAEAT